MSKDIDKGKSKDYYPLFNKKGKAEFYLDRDKIHIYKWDGEPVAFVEKGGVFTFKAKLLGFYDDGWLRDAEGKCVGFSEVGKSGPNPPKTKQRHDAPADKKEAPEKPEIKDAPDKPARRPVWSDKSDQDFFKA